MEVAIDELEHSSFGSFNHIKVRMVQEKVVQTPAQQIINVLQQVQKTYLSNSDDGKSVELNNKINYSIDKIAKKRLYDLDLPLKHNANSYVEYNHAKNILDVNKNATQEKRKSVMINMMAQYSDQELSVNRVDSY